MFKKFIKKITNKICFHEYERIRFVGVRRTYGYGHGYESHGGVEPIYLYRCQKCGKEVTNSYFR